MPNFIIFIILVTWIFFWFTNKQTNYSDIIINVLYSFLSSLIFSLVLVFVLSVNPNSTDKFSNIYPIDSVYWISIKKTKSDDKNRLCYVVKEKDSLGNFVEIEIPADVHIQHQTNLPRMNPMVSYEEITPSWIAGTNFSSPDYKKRNYKWIYLPENYLLKPEITIK